MRRFALLLNLVSLVFTSLVVATDGLSSDPVYIVLTLVMLLIPFITALVLLEKTKRPALEAAGNAPISASLERTAFDRAAAVANILLLAFVCWAIVDQYPHPPDPGVDLFTVIVVVTPIVSAIALIRRPSPHAA